MVYKFIIIGTCIIAFILFYYWAVKKYYINKSGSGIEPPPKPKETQPKVKWWEMKLDPSKYLNNYNLQNTHLPNIKSILKKTGTGLNDSSIQQSSVNTITNDDLDNYVSSYDKIRDQSVIEDIDPSAEYDISSDLNSTDPSLYLDNTQYGLYISPDDSNYEIVTSKQLYEQSDFPILYDQQYQAKDVTLYIDDNQNILPVSRDSINSTDNIDPAYTDGNVYYPANDDINTDNLYSLIKSSINDRIESTQSVYLENNMLDDSVFNIT